MAGGGFCFCRRACCVCVCMYIHAEVLCPVMTSQRVPVHNFAQTFCKTIASKIGKGWSHKEKKIFLRKQFIQINFAQYSARTKSTGFSRSEDTESTFQVWLLRVEMKRLSSPEELAGCRTPLPLLVQRFGRGLRLHALSEWEGGSAKTPQSDCWRPIIPSQRLVSDNSGWLGREAAEIWISESLATKRNPVKRGLALRVRAAPSDGALLWWKETLMPLTGSLCNWADRGCWSEPGKCNLRQV